jgi:hypothetical protein
MRVQRRDDLIGESDVAGLLRGVEPLLRETVSRAIAITCDAPPAGLCIQGGTDDLEVLVLLAAHRLVHGAASGGELRVAVERTGVRVDVVLALRLDPTGATATAGSDPDWEAIVADAARSIAARCGIEIVDDGPHAKRLRARLADD